MKPNVDVLVAMSLIGIAACNPISGVYHRVRKRNEVSIILSHLEQTTQTDGSNERVTQLLGP